MTSRQTSLCIICISVIALASPSAQADNLKKIEKKLAAKSRKIKSFSGKVKITEEKQTSGTKPSTILFDSDVSFEWMSKNARNYYRIETTRRTTQKAKTNKPSTVKEKNLLISDGEYSYMLDECVGQTTAIKADVIARFQFSKDTLEYISSIYKCKVCEDQKIGEFDCYVIELETEDKGPLRIFSKLVYYFDKKTGIPIRREGYNKKSKKVLEETITELKLNPKIAEENFEFKVPEGVEFLDMTRDKSGSRNH